MLRRLRRWREDRQLAAITLPDAQWQEAIAVYPRAVRMPEVMLRQWREQSLRFLLRKRFYSGSGFVITDAVRLRISALATLPVLGLGLDWYDDWDSLIVYETAFFAPFEEQDEIGLVSHDREPRSGEAWLQGPVILSWEDVCEQSEPGFNVVIHEVAHKLDMRNGDANGFPPLHRDMSSARWHEIMQSAWQSAHLAEQRGQSPLIDPYALEGPGEFFSVLSELFFMQPEALQSAWPDVYEHLVLFYRLEPIRSVLYPW